MLLSDSESDQYHSHEINGTVTNVELKYYIDQFHAKQGTCTQYENNYLN